MPKSYQQIAKKNNNCPINNQMSYPFFHFKWIYWFFSTHLSFSIFLTFLKIFLKISKNEQRYEFWIHIFYQDSISCTRIFRVIDLFSKWYFEKRKKIAQIHTDFEKSIIYLKCLPIILSTNLFCFILFTNFFSELFEFFFQIFVISRNTKILIKSNYWFGVNNFILFKKIFFNIFIFFLFLLIGKFLGFISILFLRFYFIQLFNGFSELTLMLTNNFFYLWNSRSVNTWRAVEREVYHCWTLL